MTKNYAPARVINPSSLQHLLRLQPGQSFILSLDRHMYSDDPNVEITDGNFALTTVEKKGSYQEYTFSPTKNVNGLAAYSSSFLGEVWIDYPGMVSKVVLLQECLNQEKADHITVANPDHCDIRIRPHNIMELVVFDKKFGYQDEWEWEWKPNVEHVFVEEIGKDTLGLYSWHEFHEYMDIDPPGYRYARYPRTEVSTDEFCRQHHFWFRFDGSLLPFLEKDHGTRHIGDFKITGYDNQFHHKTQWEAQSWYLSVHVELKKKYRTRFLATLGLKSRSEFSLYDYKQERCDGVISGNYPLPKKSTKPQGNIVVPTRTKYKQYFTPPSPTEKEVVINKIDTGTLEEGCTVLSAEPPPVKTNQVYEFDEDFLIGYPALQRQRTHNQQQFCGYGQQYRGPWD